MKKISIIVSLFFCASVTVFAQQNSDSTKIIQFVFTSDAHYGITRMQFRGDTNVDAHVVNQALLEKINTVSSILLPQDSGLNAGQLAGPVDFLVEGGDIANRMELPIQSAAISWGQFGGDYLDGLKLTSHAGRHAEVYIVPGNHDISNAVGFYRQMMPAIDASSMINIFNVMMKPSIPKTKETYHYPADKINYSKDINGIHFMFINLWPDSLERIWMDQDLKIVSLKEPVIIFTHDQPESEAKHFTNPNPPHGIDSAHKFENLLAEYYKDDLKIGSEGQSKTNIEQNGWVQFLKKHPNIKAYFHGNSNYNEFYTYKGPDSSISLPAFRVDSPMKGKYSSKDEKKLSFHLVTIDANAGEMTVRECLWNTDPDNAQRPLQWGSSKTISLK
jgi:hypothetical protein